jgi:hypothetical protein
MNTGTLDKTRLLTTVAALAALMALTATDPVRAAPDERGSRSDRPDRVERRDDRRDDRAAPRPDARHDARPEVRRDHRDDGRWYDGAHGHNHRYPAPGRVVVLPPRPPPPVWWGGVGYRYWDGVWATSGPHGWVTVRPPLGIWVTDLPSWRTALVIGGLTYYYVNGVYYRNRNDGGYEVVPPPVAQPDAPPPDRTFVYPRQGQSAQQQASDEYECHRWAVTQSNFDPTGAATGQVTTVTSNARGDYQRARAACLEGRGYTVR